MECDRFKQFNMSSGVKYDNVSSTAKVDSGSTSRLVINRENTAMKTRLIYGSIVVLLVTVLALVVALVVVSVNKSEDNGAREGTANKEQQTGEFMDLPVVDCSYATTNLDKAKCVLDSYPLVDG